MLPLILTVLDSMVHLTLKKYFPSVCKITSILGHVMQIYSSSINQSEQDYHVPQKLTPFLQKCKM